MAERERLGSTEEKERFRRKIAEMVTNFCVEASVLVSVLGIMEAAIAWRGFPPLSDFLYSLGIGASFFGLGCIIQFSRVDVAASA